MYALSLFLPTIIKGLGYSSAIAQLLTIPVYAAASIACIAVGYFSDRMGQRSLFTLVCYGAVFVGFLIAVAPSRFIPGLTYAGCFIAASGSYPGTSTTSTVTTDDILIKSSYTGPPSPVVQQLRASYETRCRNGDSDWAWEFRRRGGVQLLQENRRSQVSPGTLPGAGLCGIGLPDRGPLLFPVSEDQC